MKMSKERYNTIIDDVYKNYLKNSKKYTGCCPDCGEGYENEKGWEDNDECICGSEKKSTLLSKEQFINKIKTDDEFSEKWGYKIS